MPTSDNPWYGPYYSIGLANLAVPLINRSGTIVGIIQDNLIFEHIWYSYDTSDVGLVPTSQTQYAPAASLIGKQGPAGEQGPIGLSVTGPQGIPGVQGIPGTANTVSWTAAAFTALSQVSYLETLWKSTGATLSTDVPGTSALWVDITKKLYGPYTSIALANAAVPNTGSMRTNRVVGITTGGITIDYTWHPGNLTDSGLVEKTLIPVVVGKNKYNKLDISVGGHTQQNYGINSSGVIAVTAGWISAKIPVIANTVYSFIHNNAAYAPGSVGLMAYMNAAGTVLSTVDMSTLTAAGGLGGKTFTTPTNCAFIFKNVSLFTHNYLNDFQLELGSSTTVFEVYLSGVESINGKSIKYPPLPDLTAYTQKAEVLTGPSKNKYNKVDISSGGQTQQNYGINTSGVIGANAGWISAKIPVTASTVYSFIHNNAVYSSGSVGLMAYLNSAGTILSTVDMSTLTAAGGLGGKTFTTPVNCAFVFKNVSLFTHNYLNDFQLELGPNTTTFEAYELIVVSVAGKTVKQPSIPVVSTFPLIDRNVALLGDSITQMAAPNSWVTNMLARVSFKSLTNFAKSGATWSHLAGTTYDITSSTPTTNGNVIWNQYNKLVNNVNAAITPIPDCIVIIAGTNDYVRTVGDVTTAFTGTVLDKQPGEVLDVCTAVRFVCENILASYPLCQIILATPLQKGLPDNTIMRTLGDAIEGCANRLSLYSIRQDKHAGIYGFNEITPDIFLSDNLHLNSAGALKIGKFFTKELSLKII